MWRPFAVKSVNLNDPFAVMMETWIQSGVDFFFNHLEVLCGHDTKIYDFVIFWLAQMFQYPENKTIELIFISQEGAGKGLLKAFEQMQQYLLGRKVSVVLRLIRITDLYLLQIVLIHQQRTRDEILLYSVEMTRLETLNILTMALRLLNLNMSVVRFIIISWLLLLRVLLLEQIFQKAHLTSLLKIFKEILLFGS